MSNKDFLDQFSSKNQKPDSFKEEEKVKIKMLNSESSKEKIAKPIVIPSALTGDIAKIAKGESKNSIEDILDVDEEDIEENIEKEI